ncbi:MAG: T9SS type A sorting domain-containing protein [Ferruginibacter sp.]
MKTLFLSIFTTLVIFMQAKAQGPSKQWDVDFGGTENEQFAASQQTKDGGHIIGGYSESDISGDKTQTTRGSSDYWVVKTNASGVKQWDARFGGSSVDQLIALQQTTDGGYLLGGISFSGIGGDKTQASRGQSDYWVVKIDGNGVKEWDATFGGNSFDELHSLQQTADGGYILGGSSISGISGDKTQASQGGKDFWIVKINSNGVKQWDARFGGSKFEELFSIIQSKDGGYVLGGYSLSDPDGDKTQPSRGQFDYWVVKTDANGVKQWDASFGGTLDDWLTQLRQTTDGGYILGGWSWSGKTGDKSKPTKGDNDFWIVKIDERGRKKWDANLGGSSNDYLNAIEQTTDGGYILGGYSSSPVSGDKTQESRGGTDYWMVKTNEKGKKQWDATFGGSDFDFLYSLQQTKDGGYLLGGYSASEISGDKTSANKGPNDYWIIKTNVEGTACNAPYELIAKNIRAKEVLLKWEKVSGAVRYIINYRIANTIEWTAVEAVNNEKELHGLKAGTEYEWRVRTVCGRKNVLLSDWSASQSFITLNPGLQTLQRTVITNKITPAGSIFEVYPNPVAQSATISFSFDKTVTAVLTLLDINGQQVKTIANRNFSAGINKIKFNRESLSAGIYFLQVKMNENVITKKIVIN